jgi:tetratricopeptide (TPR) repeat protein
VEVYVAKKIRIPKKALKKPDEFITTSVRVINYISANSTRVASYIGVSLLIAFIVIGWRVHNRNLEKKAFLQLNQSIGTFHLGERAEEEPETSFEEENPEEEYDKSQEYYDNAINGLGRVISEFSDTVAATYAHLYLGHCFFKLDEFSKAAEAYEKFIDICPEQGLKTLAYPKLGRCYEEMGNYENALNYYLNLLKINDISKEFAYEGAARCYEKIGDTQKALETYQNALYEYPSSLSSLKFRKNIAILKEKVHSENPQEPDQSLNPHEQN